MFSFGFLLTEECVDLMQHTIALSKTLARNGLPARLPVAHMVCNQTPPVGDKPSLMTFREQDAMLLVFVELNGMQAELPSQFMENWCYHKDTLLSIAKHYETGETLPEEIYAKLVAAKNFRAGTFSLWQVVMLLDTTVTSGMKYCQLMPSQRLKMPVWIMIRQLRKLGDDSETWFLHLEDESLHLRCLFLSEDGIGAFT